VNKMVRVHAFLLWSARHEAGGTFNGLFTPEVFP